MANHNSNLSSGAGSNSKDAIERKKERVRGEDGVDKKTDGPDRSAE